MKILIWNMGRAIGDGIMSTGYLKIIKQIYPEAIIDIFCTKLHKIAYFNNPYVNQFYIFKTMKKRKMNVTRLKILMNPLCQLSNLLKARKEKYDIIIDTGSINLFSNRLMLSIIARPHTKIFGMYSEIIPIEKQQKLHKFYTDVYKSCAYEFLGKDIKEQAKYDLYPAKECIEKAVNYFNNFHNENNNAKIVIFNGEGSDRTISSDRIITSINELLENDENIYIFFLGFKGYGNKYIDICNKINSKKVNITYKTTIEDTTALLQNADLLISVDTALIHIASGVGTKIIEIISDGLKNYWFGWPRFVEYKIIKNKKDYYDLDGYSDDELIQAYNDLMIKE